VLAITVLSFVAFRSKFTEESLETEMKNLIRSRVRLYNVMPYFTSRGMSWRTTKDCFWLSLKLPVFGG